MAHCYKLKIFPIQIFQICPRLGVLVYIISEVCINLAWISQGMAWDSSLILPVSSAARITSERALYNVVFPCKEYFVCTLALSVLGNNLLNVRIEYSSPVLFSVEMCRIKYTHITSGQFHVNSHTFSGWVWDLAGNYLKPFVGLR